MKKWTSPKISKLGVEKTSDNCLTKDKHHHDKEGHSSSSCTCIDWTPIGPSFPITPPSQS